MSAMSVWQSCNLLTDDIIFHLARECSNVCVVSKSLQFRNNVSEKLGAHIFDILWNLQDEDRLVFMLGGTNPDVQSSLSDKDYSDFLSISARLLKSLFS